MPSQNMHVWHPIQPMEIFNLEQTSTGYYRSVKIEIVLVQSKVHEALVRANITALSVIFYCLYIYIIYLY